MIMKRVILVHRWDGSPDADWYPWLKQELEKRNVKVEIPAMPHPERPEIASWVSFLKQSVKQPDHETYFIGHSVGCQTILRYLQTFPSSIRIGGCIFVAGWFTLAQLETEEERTTAGPWLTETFDFNAMKKRKLPFVALFSDDDPFVPIENRIIFEKKLGARVITEPQQGHYNNAAAPRVLHEILALLHLS